MPVKRPDVGRWHCFCWQRCLPSSLLQTTSASMQALVPARKPVNGKWHFSSFLACLRRRLHGVCSAAVRQSVLVRKAVNGSWPCAFCPKCDPRELLQTSSASVQGLVPARNVLAGPLPCSCCDTGRLGQHLSLGFFMLILAYNLLRPFRFFCRCQNTGILWMEQILVVLGPRISVLNMGFHKLGSPNTDPKIL